MNEDFSLPDLEKEKRTNKKLAIAIGVLGLGAFGAFYILFFITMIFRPGLLFNMMPMQAITTQALSDNSRIYLLSQKIDMSRVSFKDKKQPEIKHVLSVLEGTKSVQLQEIPPAVNAGGAGDRLVLFSNGMYRSFDGSAWTEVRSDGIGNCPKGIATPNGLFIISSIDGKVRITQIRDNGATTIPFPEDLLQGRQEPTYQLMELAWYQGRLCLFWSSPESIAWTIWNGSSWATAAFAPFSGSFQVIADGRRIHFFHQEQNGTDQALSYSVFENNAWSGPTPLPVKKGLVKWNAFIHQGKPMLLLQQFFSLSLYTVENKTLADPVLLDGPFNPSRIMGTMALIAVCSNLTVILAIFGFSALIRRFKKRTWTESGIEYEFASLFRRFAAYVLDTLFLMLPPALAIALFLSRNEIAQHPLRFMMMIFSAVLFYFIGGFLYHSLLEGMLGTTLGKRICGITVLKADFTACGIGAGFLRNLLRIVDSFFYYLVAAVSLAGTLKWQRLGDLAAETVVVRRRKNAEGPSRNEPLEAGDADREDEP
jgi:uncharacterized RDD family membrane protein YckC